MTLSLIHRDHKQCHCHTFFRSVVSFILSMIHFSVKFFHSFYTLSSKYTVHFSVYFSNKSHLPYSWFFFFSRHPSRPFQSHKPHPIPLFSCPTTPMSHPHILQFPRLHNLTLDWHFLLFTLEVFTAITSLTFLGFCCSLKGKSWKGCGNTNKEHVILFGQKTLPPRQWALLKWRCGVFPKTRSV
jgi:hypothetical protein